MLRSFVGGDGEGGHMLEFGGFWAKGNVVSSKITWHDMMTFHLDIQERHEVLIWETACDEW